MKLRDGEHRLGRFRLLDGDAPVGEGGQGTIRRAVCESTEFPGLTVGATVALKVVPAPETGDARWKRFESMVSALVTLGSPNLVRYYGCFRERQGVVDVYVAVMELLEGETLRDRMARHPNGLDAGVALEIARGAAAGLGAAASAGLVHRDVKPSNIYLCSDGRVKVIDFGIARREDATSTTGFIPGTPDYMPPEVITGASRGSSAADVYALGACLYEALTGRRLFPRFKNGLAGSFEAFVVRARQMRAPKLNAPLVMANPELERLLRRMTDPDISRRMSSLAEVEMELLELQDACERGEWTIPPPDADGAEASDASDTVTAADSIDAFDAPTAREVRTETTVARLPRSGTPPVPWHRRIIRNRREMFLVLALIVELASNAVIVWQRPRPQPALERVKTLVQEHREMSRRLKASEKARAKAEQEAIEAKGGSLAVPVEKILIREGGK